MKKTYYIIAGVIAVVLIGVLFLVVSPKDDDTTNDKESKSKTNYSEKQIKWRNSVNVLKMR